MSTLSAAIYVKLNISNAHSLRRHRALFMFSLRSDPLYVLTGVSEEKNLGSWEVVAPVWCGVLSGFIGQFKIDTLVLLVLCYILYATVVVEYSKVYRYQTDSTPAIICREYNCIVVRYFNDQQSRGEIKVFVMPEL